jgi:branched-chain amino acid transport system substrate-binding protein
MQDLAVFSGSASMIWAQLNQLSSVIPKNLYFVGFGYNADQARSAEGERKLKQFRDGVTAAGMHVDGITGLSWDGAAIVIDALRAVGPDATSEQLRAWVASQRNYAGIAGLYNFQMTSTAWARTTSSLSAGTRRSKISPT